MAFLLIYVPQVILLAWALHQTMVSGQSESVITAYLSVGVGTISSLIATATFHSNAYERRQAEKANAPLLLIVGKSFSDVVKKDSWTPQFDWENRPEDFKGQAEYGILNKGAAVIVTNVVQQARDRRKTNIIWKTFSVSRSTRIEQVYHGRQVAAVSVPSADIRSSTPFFDMWMNLSAEPGRPVTIHYIEPTSKRVSKITFEPEKLPVASRNAFKAKEGD
jgi:hypothetical protein